MPLRVKEVQSSLLLSGSYYSAVICLAAFGLMVGSWFFLGSSIYGESLQLDNSLQSPVGVSYSGALTQSSVTRYGFQWHSQGSHSSAASTTRQFGITSSLAQSQQQKLSSPRPGDNLSIHHLAAGILDIVNSVGSVPTPVSTPSVSNPSPDDTTVKVAIIGAIGLVLSVTVPAIIATINRGKSTTSPSATEETPVERELRRRAEAAEDLVHQKDLEIKQRARGTELRDKRIDDLERLLWSRGIDPATPPPLIVPEPSNDS